MARTATIDRKTAETAIHLELELDGSGSASVTTGVGFFDHMLTHLARHALFDLVVQATGDQHVDDHHTVEDVGICFGLALAEALGNRAGIARYGDASVPMDEALVSTAIDLSGRAGCFWNVAFDTEKIGSFDVQLVEEFFRAVCRAGGLTLHAILAHGHNSHHVAEATFKSAARSLRQAVALDQRQQGIPSTKGIL